MMNFLFHPWVDLVPASLAAPSDLLFPDLQTTEVGMQGPGARHIFAVALQGTAALLCLK